MKKRLLFIITVLLIMGAAGPRPVAAASSSTASFTVLPSKGTETAPITRPKPPVKPTVTTQTKTVVRPYRGWPLPQTSEAQWRWVAWLGIVVLGELWLLAAKRRKEETNEVVE